MTVLTYPFDETEMQRAADEWGANCGPSALAFALQRPVGEMRGVIPGFDEKGYTSPSMMRNALKVLGQRYISMPAPWPKVLRVTNAPPCLVRIQWTGPWTDAGANPKWAYRYTHWIASWLDSCVMVFDCNGGIRTRANWDQEIVPLLTAMYPRAYGGWLSTHVWQLAAANSVITREVRSNG